MKNKYTLVLLLFVYCSLFAQKNSNENLVIYSTSNKNTTLFFNNPIKNGIVGNQNFTFGYNKENYGKIGILKSTAGEESNLLVITENGNIFSFIIRYKPDIDKVNYFISDTLAIGNEAGNFIKKVDDSNINKRVSMVSNDQVSGNNLSEAVTVNNFQVNDLLNVNEEEEILKKLCATEIDKPLFYNRIYGAKSKVMVKLKNISYLNNELFFTLILKNESTLDYDINYLNFYITSRKKRKNAASQTIPYEYKYVHNLPSRISSGQVSEVVYVFSKFSLNENKLLLIELREDNGERNIKLEVPNNFINNPNK